MLVAAFYYFLGDNFTLFNVFELKTLDFRFKLRGPVKPPGGVVVVAIDDYSIDRLGRWPWSRAYHAELVDVLGRDGAKVVGFDLIFTEPEESSELKTMRQLRQYYETLGVSKATSEGRGFGKLLNEALDASNNDRLFADSITRNGNVVIALVFQDFGPPSANPKAGGPAAEGVSVAARRAEEGRPEDEPPPGLLAEEKPSGEAPPEELLGDESLTDDMLLPDEVKDAAIGGVEKSGRESVVEGRALLLPLPEYYTSAKELGHVNTFSDLDGNLRWANLLLAHAGRYYPALGIKMLKEYYGLGDEALRAVPGRAVSLGERQAPVDGKGNMLINYYGPARSFPYYPYADAVEGALPPGTFKDKIVLVGYAATGLGDVWTTPFSQAMPGVEKHATVMANIMEGNYLHRAWRVADVLFILAVGLVLGYFLPRLSPLRVASFALVTIVASIAVSFASFYFLKIWLNAVYPVLNGILVSSSVVIYKFFTEEKEKRLVKKAFKQYLSPALVEELVKHPENLRLGGEKKELTVLFSDIREFTSISEKLSPEMLVSLLNAYLSSMTGIILENKGLVDKFIGDAIMAVYGAPIPFKEHPRMACATAVNMVRALDRLRPEWRERGFPDFDIGVGINTGMMIAGNMGSEERFDYTVMGDSVNLASRLEGLNKAYGTSIIVSEFTAAGAEGFALRELDMVRVKGRAMPVRIFEVMGFDGEFKDRAGELKAYREALGLYREMRWADAMEVFNGLAGKSGLKLYKLYSDRCGEFLKSPPSGDWDGVFTFTKK